MPGGRPGHPSLQNLRRFVKRSGPIASVARPLDHLGFRACRSVMRKPVNVHTGSSRRAPDCRGVGKILERSVNADTPFHPHADYVQAIY